MKTVVLHLLIVLIVHPLWAQQPVEPTGRRLKDIQEDLYADQSLIIGGTIGAWALETNSGVVLDREFNYVTPENDYKQWNIHPDNSNTWNWSETDEWVDHIAEQGQILRMHGPIGPQCSNWAQDDSRTAEELETNLVAFFQASCERYNGVPGIEYIDVVNETLINGQWHRPKPGTNGWENPWYKIGVDNDANATPLYIKMAYEIAKEYAPDMKTIFNHHENPEVENSWDKIKETITYLREQGLVVDGIGWQAHVDVEWETPENLQKYRDLVDWAHENDLEFHVTEASVWVRDGSFAGQSDEHADTYRAILDVLIQKRENGKVGWNTWQIDDGTAWNKEFHPALFDASFNPKPAYYAIQEALENSEVLNVIADAFLNDNTSFDIYPNPAKNSFHYQSRDKFSSLTIKVIDNSGRQVSSNTYTLGQNIEFETSSLEAGIYFVEAYENDSYAGRQKLIIAR